MQDSVAAILRIAATESCRGRDNLLQSRLIMLAGAVRIYNLGAGLAKQVSLFLHCVATLL